MSETEIRIRYAHDDDAKELLGIYRPYVEKTAITFEYDVPTLEDFRNRIIQTTKEYPYLVAERGDKILGYAYASRFHPRAAYQWSVETSIYVAEDSRQAGVGKRLYEALESILKEMGICNLNACIAYPQKSDEHLDDNSVKYHEHLGYTMVGRFHNSGYKFDTWYDMVWMEKMIGEHLVPQPEIRSFPEVKEICNMYLSDKS